MKVAYEDAEYEYEELDIVVTMIRLGLTSLTMLLWMRYGVNFSLYDCRERICDLGNVVARHLLRHSTRHETLHADACLSQTDGNPIKAQASFQPADIRSEQVQTLWPAQPKPYRRPVKHIGRRHSGSEVNRR